MIKNYLKTALRNFVRHKGYSIINIVGLAVGMACCILILLWVQDELSFDRFHENGDNIYRVIQDIQFTDHKTTWAITQGPLGPALMDDFPEIVNYARLTGRRMRLSYGENSFDEILGMIDGSAFDMFTFPLISGDPRNALTDPHSIVLTDEMAKKYFGDENPIGKILKADDHFDFLVTGIMKPIPLNSHFSYDFFIPFIFGRELNYSVDRWNNSGFTTYIQLQKGVTGKEAILKISGYLYEKPTIEKDAKLNLQPLKRIHLHSRYEFDRAHGDITYVRIFSLIAFFILLIACINFMNLTTARSANRAREVGMRKVVGATRRHLIRQFFGEAILLTFIALLIAIVIVIVLLPFFNNLAAKELSLIDSGNLRELAGLFLIALVTGVIAGSYPAVFLSAFRPVRVLKGSVLAGAKGGGFRRILVVLQFSMTILLIICTSVVDRQLDFMRNSKLGYDKENLIYVPMRGGVRENFDAVKNTMLQHPSILGVTACANVPTYGYSFSNSLWHWEGQTPDEEILMRATFIDYDYFETFGMKLVEGRDYSKEFTTDPQEALIVNEAAVQIMRMDSPLGKTLGVGDFSAKIIGVVEDYHFRSLQQEIEPLILILNPANSRLLFARISSNAMPATIENIERTWEEFAPGYPFDYRFLDEALNELYRAEQRTGTIFRYFSALAILISCLGLFGLASFMAEQRTKEIGIRKVLGATVSNVLLLLSKEFFKWILAGNIIAWPVAYFAMGKWLQNYAYRINIPLASFLLASFVALAVALLTVSFQTLKAAVANPADSLRYE